jgi:hypothetical protein
MPVTGESYHENQESDHDQAGGLERVDVRRLAVRRAGLKLALWSGGRHENIVAPI